MRQWAVWCWAAAGDAGSCARLWRVGVCSVLALACWAGPRAAPAVAAFPGGNGLVAFQVFVDGSWDIRAVAPDGTGLVSVTSGPWNDEQPVWSPDGRRIAFARWGGPDGVANDIFVVNADGSGLTRLTDTPWQESAPAWSPDGEHVVFHRFGRDQSGLWVAEPDGGGEAWRLPVDADPLPTEPLVSPDGRRLAFVHVGSIYLVRLPRGTPRRAAFQPAGGARELNWSPDGARLVFLNGDGDTIFSIEVDGTGLRALTDGTGGLVEPAFSPDGSEIVASGTRSLDGSPPTGPPESRFSGLWLLGSNGGGFRRIPNTERGWRPDWQPVRSEPLPVLEPDPLAQPQTGVAIEVELPARYGLRDPDGLVRPARSPDEVRPDGFAIRIGVRVDGEQCRRRDTVVVRLAGELLPGPPDGRCSIRARVRGEGVYRVEVVVARGDRVLRASRRVVVQDFLIVGIGDSNGAGEGDPDRGGGRSARWGDPRCHRSAGSYQAQVAATAEAVDDGSSVTFVHLACSGASIARGLLGPYRGIEDPGHDVPPLRSQVSAIQTLTRGREIDALLVSAGINEIGFGKLVAFCLAVTDCPGALYPNDRSLLTLDQHVQSVLEDVPEAFDRLAVRLDRAGVAPARVYVTEYFDSTRDDAGNVCPALVDPSSPLPGDDVFDQAEATWASERVLAPLNAIVADAAARHEWHYVSGSATAFATHGYCATDSWITTLLDSVTRQHDAYGTLHANRDGNRVNASIVWETLRGHLLPGGTPRRPAP